VIVVIPSIGLSPYLPDLLRTLVEDSGIERVFVADNSDEGWPSREQIAGAWAWMWEKVTFIKCAGASIYDSWNHGISIATRKGVPCAILNDDVILEPHSLQNAARFLNDEVMLVGLNHSRPWEQAAIPVHGTFRTGGFGGFAFVVGPGCPHVHPGFRWWYGDDDLAYRITESGYRMLVALDAPVQHPYPSLSSRGAKWVPEAIAADTALFDELWPGRR